MENKKNILITQYWVYKKLKPILCNFNLKYLSPEREAPSKYDPCNFRPFETSDYWISIIEYASGKTCRSFPKHWQHSKVPRVRLFTKSIIDTYNFHTEYDSFCKHFLVEDENHISQKFNTNEYFVTPTSEINVSKLKTETRIEFLNRCFEYVHHNIFYLLVLCITPTVEYTYEVHKYVNKYQNEDKIQDSLREYVTIGKGVAKKESIISLHLLKSLLDDLYLCLEQAGIKNVLILPKFDDSIYEYFDASEEYNNSIGTIDIYNLG